MRNNPQQILDEMPMGRLQVAAVCICVLLNGLDGFDVLAISFAAPGIAAEWGINRAALGVVLSMELIGMSIGSIFLGGVADRFGRRPMILLCLVLMTAGMFLAAQAGDVVTLSLIRLVTGLGIGGMLASTNAMVAEYSNARRRDFCIAVMVAGYPLGVIIGGTFASMLLAYFDWRSVFLLGAVGTAAMFPVVWLFLPESIAHLVHKRGPGALEKINATLKRMGHGIIDALPELAQEGPKASWRDLFSPGLVRITLLLTLCYLTHIMTFYFILKWVPKIVVDMGFAASAAGGVLVWGERRRRRWFVSVRVVNTLFPTAKIGHICDGRFSDNGQHLRTRSVRPDNIGCSRLHGRNIYQFRDCRPVCLVCPIVSNAFTRRGHWFCYRCWSRRRRSWTDNSRHPF